MSTGLFFFVVFPILWFGKFGKVSWKFCNFFRICSKKKHKISNIFQNHLLPQWMQEFTPRKALANQWLVRYNWIQPEWNQHSPEKLSPDHLPPIQSPSMLHGVLVGSDSLWPITNNNSTHDRSKLTSLFSFSFSQQFFSFLQNFFWENYGIFFFLVKIRLILLLENKKISEFTISQNWRK
jgi:hypothetical protein